MGERSVGALPKEFPPRDPFTQIDFSRIFCPDVNWYKKRISTRNIMLHIFDVPNGPFGHNFSEKLQKGWWGCSN